MGLAPITDAGRRPGAAASLFLLRDPDWRAKLYAGGWLLLLPVVGWPAAMGYRKALIGRLYAGEPAVLPPWRGRFWHHVGEGYKAMAVIYGQYAPLFAAFAWLLWHRGATPQWWWLGWAAVVVTFPITSTTAFPSACLLAWWFGGYLHWWEAAALVAGYTLVTYVIPAGFLQVSLTGQYQSALRYDRSLPLAWRTTGPYLRAWVDSLVMVAASHFTGPFAPWGVVWSYVGIIYAFNAVLADDLRRRGELPAGSWFDTLAVDGALGIEPHGRLAWVTAPGGDPAWAVRAGAVYMPLPKSVACRLVRSKWVIDSQASGSDAGNG